tara:strand:- start:1329 stop:1472 length:144 start_codon:yes stop_codon:yes gene_type:complete
VYLSGLILAQLAPQLQQVDKFGVNHRWDFGLYLSERENREGCRAIEK